MQMCLHWQAEHACKRWQAGRAIRSLAKAQHVFEISWALHSATRMVMAAARLVISVFLGSVSSVAYAHTMLACAQAVSWWCQEMSQVVQELSRRACNAFLHARQHEIGQ